MFRFTIRELLFIFIICGLSSGWWIDHKLLSHGKAEVIEDATMLATFSVEEETCGVAVASYHLLRQKYGGQTSKVGKAKTLTR